jgi:hypothetical protein
MIKLVIINTAEQTSEVLFYPYAHTARSWLLLWGFLPSQQSEYYYKNYLTGSTAIITVGPFKQ